MASFTPQSAVLVAAEPTLYRTGLVSLLNQQWPTTALTLTADMSQLVDLIRTQSFQLLILDDSSTTRTLPTLLNSLRQAKPMQRVVVLTTNYSSISTTTPFHSFIPRHSPPVYLIDKLNSLLSNTPCQHTYTRVAHAIPTRFSPRELEVLRLVVDDYCNQEIATQLYLSVRTIESHRRALLQKSGTRTLTGLVAWALRTGIIA
jgi:DNA-binding NarL/FixJ family response regulator